MKNRLLIINVCNLLKSDIPSLLYYLPSRKKDMVLFPNVLSPSMEYTDSVGLIVFILILVVFVRLNFCLVKLLKVADGMNNLKLLALLNNMSPCVKFKFL